MDLGVAAVSLVAARYLAPEAAKLACGFMSRIAFPLGDEIGKDVGSLYRDFRKTNFLKAAASAQKNLEAAGWTMGPLEMPHEFTFRVMEEASKCENDRIQQMWGGLMASVCKEKPKDGAELLWVNLLSRMTPRQAVLLEWSARETRVRREPNGAIETECLSLNSEIAAQLFPETSRFEVIGEVDQLKRAGLLHPAGEGDIIEGMCAAATISGLLLYKRSQGETAQRIDPTPPGDKPRRVINKCAPIARWG